MAAAVLAKAEPSPLPPPPLAPAQRVGFKVVGAASAADTNAGADTINIIRTGHVVVPVSYPHDMDWYFRAIAIADKIRRELKFAAPLVIAYYDMQDTIIRTDSIVIAPRLTRVIAKDGARVVACITNAEHVHLYPTADGSPHIVRVVSHPVIAAAVPRIVALDGAKVDIAVVP